MKNIFRKYIFIFFSGLGFLMFVSGCSNPEDDAQKLLLKAEHAKVDGNRQHELTLYKQLIEKYPETKAALEAKKKLQSHENDVEKNFRSGLDVFKLDNGRYPTTQEGLKALWEDPGGKASWRGPYINEMYKEYAIQFSYENVDDKIKLERKRLNPSVGS